jgi:hypothetical protein
MAAEDELVLTQQEPDRAWRFDLVLPVLFRPRTTLGRIVAHHKPIWRAPLVLLILAAVASALVAGSIAARAAAAGQPTLPPDFEFLTPEQQAQFLQAATATNNPTFNYVLPALGAALGVIVVWLLIGWLLHLLLTLLGGRGTSGSALNVAAFAAAPALLRYGVQIVAMLVTGQAIAAPGLAGFAPAGEGFANALLAGMLSHVDVYLIWQIILLYIGVRLSSQLTRAKCWLAVLLTILIVLALRALPAAVLAQFGGMTVIRPFL